MNKNILTQILSGAIGFSLLLSALQCSSSGGGGEVQVPLW